MNIKVLAIAACAAMICIGVAMAQPDFISALHSASGFDVVTAGMMGIPLNDRARGLIAIRADGGQTPDVKALLEEMAKTFENFKAEHTKEIDDLKKKQGDVVQAEKVTRISAEIDKLQKAIDETNSVIAALKVGGAGDGKPLSAERKAHAAGFNKFFRKGAEAGLRDLEVKAALRTDSDPDGGYLVPEEMETTIDRVVGTLSVMRQLASVRSISTDSYKKLVNLGGAGYGWVGERSSRPETNTPTLSELVFNMMEIYANPAATQTLLDDARIDIAAWLADEVQIAFAEQEGAAFITGDGTLKPRGILAYDTVANASYTWGKIGFVTSGVAAALTDATHNGTDALIDLYYSLRAPYRNGAAYIVSDAVMGTVRKFKDGEGNYIWAPPSAAGEVATVLGKPVYSDDNMQAVAANAFPIAFGNFKRGYLIVDRFGIRVLRDPYTNKPWVHFYTTKRVGGGVQNFEAIKLLKVST